MRNRDAALRLHPDQVIVARPAEHILRRELQQRGEELEQFLEEGYNLCRVIARTQKEIVRIKMQLRQFEKT
jgi:hypothetical protein